MRFFIFSYFSYLCLVVRLVYNIVTRRAIDDVQHVLLL